MSRCGTFRKKRLIPFIILLGMVFYLEAVEFKGQNIDGRHFSATIWMKGHDIRYRVDVVFLKRAANIVFQSGQILPHTLRNDRYMSLYLERENIDSLSAIMLKQVIPPDEIDENNSDPEKWEVGARWIMKIDPDKQL